MIFVVTVDVILFQNQLLDVLSDDDDGSSQTSSSSTSTYAAFEIVSVLVMFFYD